METGKKAPATTLRIGTRGSKLALWQAEFTRQLLTEQNIDSELVIIKTKGDQIQHLSFDKIEGKGFFTKEIEDALLRGDVDLAVHSMKDLPTQSPEGLAIAAVSYREDPADWLIINKEALDNSSLFQLKSGAIVGTSSARRKAQMLDFRPDVQFVDLRGNVPTRLEKLQAGQADAILLAAAGLRRLDLDLSSWQVVRLNPKEFVPAPAQGVLAWQSVRTDKATREILKSIHQPQVARATNVERKILQLMGGGCHMPLGAYCEIDAFGQFHVWAAMAPSWDAPLRRIQRSSATHFQLAEEIAAALKS